MFSSHIPGQGKGENWAHHRPCSSHVPSVAHTQFSCTNQPGNGPELRLFTAHPAADDPGQSQSKSKPLTWETCRQLEEAGCENPASKNHSRKMVLLQTLSSHIILPCQCNNEGETISHHSLLCEDVASVQKDVWISRLKQLCQTRLLRSSDLGRHISHTLPTTAALVTAQAAQNGGQETQTCNCTAKRFSPGSENWALTPLLLNFHHPTN